MSNLSKTVSDIEDSLNKAYAYFEVWWALDHTGIKNHHAAMNELDYVDFFHTTITAHYQCMFTSLSKIFDRAEDLSGIKKLKFLLNEAGQGDLVKHLENNLKIHEPVIKAVKGIRDQSIAHKKGAKNVRQIYSENGVTPNQIRDLIHELINIMITISNKINFSWSLYATNRFENATLNLLQKLEHNTYEPYLRQ
ncbi:hypothetical protein AADZ84_16245 [Colwelliaceae bacterium MEBiC 14330]